jgi:hypothetical protein
MSSVIGLVSEIGLADAIGLPRGDPRQEAEPQLQNFRCIQSMLQNFRCIVFL